MVQPVAAVRRRLRPLRRRLSGLGRRPLTVGRYRPPRDLRPLREDEQAATDAFHRAYYESWDQGGGQSRGTVNLSWFGYRTLKSPLDLWTYQEILVDTRPDLIIETGTHLGGSALYLASIMDLLGHGSVLTVDITAAKGLPVHPRIRYLVGSSVGDEIVSQMRAAAKGKRVMVLLDSDHSAAHVRQELATYADLVSVGCYLVVEDTNVNGHPVKADFGPGPMEALVDFLAGRDDFVSDPDRERFLMTLNPRGFLRRVR
jgi:cephalosporin hydroxylase